MKKVKNLTLIPFIILFLCIFPSKSNGKNLITPTAEYRFDECQWNGTQNEVKDSNGNGLDGTAKNGATTESNATAGGVLCHVGKFDGNNDYIDMGNILNPNSDDWSISV